jgi:NAD(P)-dependent dehydrogenase (short-subunit alcohol dehydrogenase family)
MSLFDLSGKVALLTGASKGMGQQMATALAEQGATVVISARKQDRLDEAAAEINAAVGAERAIPVACNVGYKDQLAALVETARAKAGPIDIVVGNAGVNPYYGPTSEIPDEAYEPTFPK